MIVDMMKSHFKEYKRLKKQYKESKARKIERNLNREEEKTKLLLKRKSYQKHKSRTDHLFEDITPRNKQRKV